MLGSDDTIGLLDRSGRITIYFLSISVTLTFGGHKISSPPSCHTLQTHEIQPKLLGRTDVSLAPIETSWEKVLASGSLSAPHEVKVTSILTVRTKR